MQAISSAFGRHQIGCSTPTVQEAGCVGRPTIAPTVTAIGTDQGADFSWNAVAGASRYKIFRTDGVQACDYGKAIVGETTGTSFSDAGLQPGREYYYVIAGFTGSDSCMGPTSACTTAIAQDGDVLFADGFESGGTTAWQ